MPGSLFFIAIVAIGAVLAAATGTIFLLVPFILFALAVVLLPVVFGAVRGTRYEPGVSEPHGVPSTSEASYEPVQQPRQP
jgi:CBS-domain-containing membrane protein